MLSPARSEVVTQLHYHHQWYKEIPIVFMAYVTIATLIFVNIIMSVVSSPCHHHNHTTAVTINISPNTNTIIFLHIPI